MPCMRLGHIILNGFPNVMLRIVRQPEQTKPLTNRVKFVSRKGAGASFGATNAHRAAYSGPVHDIFTQFCMLHWAANSLQWAAVCVFAAQKEASVTF